MSGLGIPRWLATTFGIAIMALAGLAFGILGAVLPPYFGASYGLLVSVVGIVLAYVVLANTPKRVALDSVGSLVWWVVLVSVLSMLMNSLVYYSLPFLGDMAMRAIFGLLMGGKIGTIDVL